MTKAEYYWSEEDGIVTLCDDTELSIEDSLRFLLEQADAPSTAYPHKSFTASGLAAHVRRLQDLLND